MNAQPTPPQPSKFYSAPKPHLAVWRRLLAVLGTFILGATIIGQVRGGRFPSYPDLLLVAALPLAAYVVATVGIHLLCRFASVEISVPGMKAANPFGVPRFTAWDQISGARVVSIKGTPYIVVETVGSRLPVVIPLWLQHFAEFARATTDYAGPQNPLTLLVRQLRSGADSAPHHSHV